MNEVPAHWYNILADLPDYVPHERRPPQSAPSSDDGAVRLLPQLPLTMYRQSISRDPFIEIPEEVRAKYASWRPTPLLRARAFERELDTPARIYFKYEGVSPSGSHKLNSAMAQAYYYRQAGIRELVTGTGAGQWGTALAMACRNYGLECRVFMVRCSYDQKPQRRVLMRLSGADVTASPSASTIAGKTFLAADPQCPGSLSIAASEAIEYARDGHGRRYSAGSAESHVLLHQTVIGLEALSQMSEIGEFPDTVVAAVGAGSNFAGLAFPFFRESRIQGRPIEFVAAEPRSCPKLTEGTYTWDFHDALGIMPMSKMYTLGHDFVPPPIYAGGLRYHGAAPVLSWMYHRGLIGAAAYGQHEVFAAGLAFARAEQIVPAPESAHAIRCVIDRAQRAREDGTETVILFNLSGHGLMDLGAYEHYLSGTMPSDDRSESPDERDISELAGEPGPPS